jgi:hypothetical protein
MTISWDCFDTLVTRRKFDPLSVFDDMGAKLGLADFTQRRKAAESRAPWTLSAIYEELAKDYGWSDAKKEYYKALEIEAELEHCCPIAENLSQVKDGDLIVSDMYLPAEAIEKILRKNGLSADVQIFVSTGGKSSGHIWSSLPPIDLHIGDNPHSDVASPQAHGIHAMRYMGVFPTWLEKEMGGDLGLLMRVVRLANPYTDASALHGLLGQMWLEQSHYNIPALILAALEIPENNVAFVQRDCVHLQRIHEAIHGATNAAFHCSRIALAEGGEQWREYVESTAHGKIIVDLQGTGGSIRSYWMHAFQEEPDLLYVTGTLPQGRLLVHCLHDAIERFNSSPLGSLAKFPERKRNEYDPLVLECQKQAVDCAIGHIPYFSFPPSLDRLQRLVSLMPDSVTVKLNKHIDNHMGVE